MGLEVSKGLNRIQSGDFPNLLSAIMEKNAREVAEVAGSGSAKPKFVPYLRTNGRFLQAGKYRNFLCRYGYTAYSAFALALGIKGLAKFPHNYACPGDRVLLE